MIFAASFFLILGTSLVAGASDYQSDDVGDVTGMPKHITEHSASTTHHRQLSTCPMADEQTLDYAASVTVTVFEGDPMCSDAELTQMGTELTNAWGTVAGLDPRLDPVTTLTADLCSDLPEGYERLRQRELGWFNADGSFKYNWGGDGRCRYCAESNSDSDVRRSMLRAPLPFLNHINPKEQGNDSVTKAISDEQQGAQRLEQMSRRLQKTPECTGFILHRKKTFARTLSNADIIDIGIYGQGVTVVAECNGDTRSVEFDLNGVPYHMENKAPFPLNGDGWDRFGRKYNPVPEFQTPGTYVITATPYSERHRGGVRGTPQVLALLIMNGATNEASGNEGFIPILEDDLSFYLSYKINSLYYGKPGHCLERCLAWVDVGLVEVDPDTDVCALDGSFLN